ncbi:hybrid sensor histidine kinase/response regulator [Salinibius halmophilus]|uniref:hybrid sensor histidine kinase/response regulator n=1 Tax=Salinibius halmophilus TaxID=1853216 RepID=UPI000E662010|nr:hybrid sensor histidine kinase/response regulator [Salinibius halmophilus]
MTPSNQGFTLSTQRVHDISRWLAMISTLTCGAFVLFSIAAKLTVFLVFFSTYAAIYGAIWLRNQAGRHTGNAVALFIAIDTGVFLLGLMVSDKPVLAPAYMLLMAFPFFYKASDHKAVVLLLAAIPLLTYLAQLVVQTLWISQPLQPLPAPAYFATVFILSCCIFACAIMIFQQFSLDRQARNKLQYKVAAQAKTYDLLDRAWQESERISQEKNKLLLTIGHELRTPLTSIIGHLDLIEERDVDRRKREHWQQIKRSSRTLSGLLDDVLEYSEFYNGNQQLSLCEVNLAELCQLVLADHQGAAILQNAELVYEGPESLIINTDSNKVRRILNHIIGNAIKFRRSNQDTNVVTLAVTADEHNTSITISDQGFGIPPEHLRHVFKAFWQPDPSLSRQHQGNGLGLYLSQQLSQLLGGELTVESQLGQGSTFTLKVPALKAAPASKNTDQKPSNFKQAMVVEDNPVNRKVMFAMLERLHLPATMMENGHEAVSNYLQSQPDVILMDLQMPVLDGLEACRKIRQIEQEHALPPCHIIAVSANATHHDRALAKSAGMDDFLVKPYRFSSLKDLLCPPEEHT